MKKNTGSPKKRPKKRHKKKQLKNRQRSLRQRLARLSALRQALAATRVMSASHSPVVEPEPEQPLPAIGGKLLWDVTINSVDAPHHFGTQPQLPPKSPDWVIIRLPAPATPLPVDAALCRQPTALRLRPSTWVLVLVSEQPPKPPTQRHRLFPSLCSPPCTIVTPYLPPSKHLEQPRQQPSPHDWPQLPRLHPTGRRVGVARALKHLKPAVIAGNAASGEEYLPFDGGEESVHYEFAFRKRLQKSKCKLRQATKPLRKKAGFIRKAYRPDKKRLSRKSIGSLKRERLGLSGSSQSRRYFMKVPCLSRVSGKVLFTRSVKLLALEIKQHSKLVTPVSAAELLRKQRVNLGYTPVEALLKPGETAVITDNATSEVPLPADDREESVHYKFVGRKYFRKKNELNRITKPFRETCGYVRKLYRPDKRRFSPKSIGSLKKQRPGLPGSRQPRYYATKTPRLIQTSGKVLLTQSVKLLAPEIKQHSELVTPVPAAELLMRQKSNLAYSPAEAPLNLGKPAVITDNATSEVQLPAGDRENSVPYEVVFIRHSRKVKQLRKTTEPFKTKSCFVKKFYRPARRRFSSKSISSLKKQRTDLSSSHQPSRYATKIPRLSRAAGRALLTKRVKLLAPEIKQHSELVTPVPAAELRMRQRSSLGYFTPDSAAAAPPSVAHFPNKVPFLRPEILADNLSGTEQQPFADGEERMSRQIIFRKRYQEIIQSIIQSITTANSSRANNDQLTPPSPTEKPLRSSYPAVIADELPNAEWQFDERAAIDSFREFFGLPQPTAGSEWEFHRAEALLIWMGRMLSEIKQRFLDEFGGVPEEFFCMMSNVIVQWNQPGLAQQDYVIRDIYRGFSEDMADFNQLVQSLAASGPTELGALKSPVDPPCEVVTTSLLTPHPGQNHPYQQP